jgi:hypothetical protein
MIPATWEVKVGGKLGQNQEALKSKKHQKKQMA